MRRGLLIALVIAAAIIAALVLAVDHDEPQCAPTDYAHCYR